MASAEHEWDVCTDRYVKYIKLERGLAANTVEAYMRDVASFRRFVMERYGISPQEVDAQIVEAFMNMLFSDGMAGTSQNRMLSGISGFYDYLLLTGVITASPLEFTDHLKMGHYLPETLTVQSVDTLLATIDLYAPQGCLNRTLISMIFTLVLLS